VAGAPRSQPERQGAGPLLRWERTLPYADDSFRAEANGVIWGVHRDREDSLWVVTRWPQPEASPQTVGVRETLAAGQALAEALARITSTP
jgi:hypothetical protein